MTDTAPRCPNCVASTGLHLALLQFDNILYCTLCAFEQPLPPTGRIVVPRAAATNPDINTGMLERATGILARIMARWMGAPA